jgi:hypothetical protein
VHWGSAGASEQGLRSGSSAHRLTQYRIQLQSQLSVPVIPSLSGKKEDVSFLITKAKAKCRSYGRYLQRTPVTHALGGAYITNFADLFDWHGRPQDVDLGVVGLAIGYRHGAHRL